MYSRVESEHLLRKKKNIFLRGHEVIASLGEIWVSNKCSLLCVRRSEIESSTVDLWRNSRMMLLRKVRSSYRVAFATTLWPNYFIFGVSCVSVDLSFREKESCCDVNVMRPTWGRSPLIIQNCFLTIWIKLFLLNDTKRHMRQCSTSEQERKWNYCGSERWTRKKRVSYEKSKTTNFNWSLTH